MVSIEKQIVIEKSAVITFDNAVDEMAFRRYLKGHWKDLTLGLKDATILFLAGIHGSNSGELGPNENIQTLKNQVKKILNIHRFSIKITSNISIIVVQARSSGC